MTENETKICQAYAKSIGTTFKTMKENFEIAVLKEAVSHFQGKRSNADEINFIASQITTEEMSEE